MLHAHSTNGFTMTKGALLVPLLLLGIWGLVFDRMELLSLQGNAMETNSQRYGREWSQLTDDDGMLEETGGELPVDPVVEPEEPPRPEIAPEPSEPLPQADVQPTQAEPTSEKVEQPTQPDPEPEQRQQSKYPVDHEIYTSQIHQPISRFFSHDQPITRPVVLVHLSGELANHFGKIAHGLSLAWTLEQKGYSPVLVMRHQDSRKWKGGNKDVHRCLPEFEHSDFSQGNTGFFDDLTHQADSELEGLWDEINSLHSVDHLYQKIDHFLDLWNQPREANETAPLLIANSIFTLHPIMEHYYDHLRAAFRWNEEACCRHVAAPDEVAFHYRNFVGEMPKRGMALGFEEINPQNLGSVLSHNESTVILGRYLHEDVVQRFRDHVPNLRKVPDQSGPQDFCLLMKAKHSIGSGRSTYYVWATFLGDGVDATAYSIDSGSVQKASRKKGYSLHLAPHLTHPILKERYRFPLIQQ